MGNDINTKMGVTGIAQYKQAMSQASQSVKTLDAALKLNEKQLQATGDKEVYMQQKSKLLQQQIAAQTNVVKQGQAALTAMEKQGVNPASAAYQKMSQQVLNAQTALLGMNQDLDSVGQSAEETAQKTDKLTDSLNGINKKVSFDAVLNGIGKITDGMEAAAKKVASLARDVWDTMAMAASWADNENTLAAMYGIDVETLQRMQGASRTIDTTVETIIKSQQKLKTNMVYGSDDVNEAFKKLGISIGYVTGKGNEIQVFRDSTDVFWEAGEALKTYADEVERDAMAQKIFGSSWRELLPLFTAGRQEYEKTLSEQSIVTEENVNKLNQLDDALQKLDQDYQATKNTILSELAPAFTVVAGGLSDLIGQVNEYLKTDEGKEKMEALGQSVTDLFNGITDVDFEQAIETAGGILDSITGALGWIKDNHTDVENAIKGIGTAFILLKAAEVVGTLAQGASALKNLIGGGSAAGAGSSVLTTAAGAATGASITSLVKSAFGGASKFVSAIGSKLGLTGLAVLTGVPMIDFFSNPEKYLHSDAQELYDSLNIDPMTGVKESLTNPEKIKKGLWSLLGLDDGQTSGAARTGEPHRTRNITGTATEESMQGHVIERTVEDIYDDLYQAINDYDPATNARDTTQFFDNVLYPLIQEAGKSSGVVGDSIDEIADLIYDKWIQSLFDDEWEGTTGGLLNILQEAIDENAKGLTVETIPVLPDDAAAMLEDQLGPITVDVIPNVKSMSFANGLPYVPFDGYVATLHKGERVVPANQNKNYNFTNNNYFDHTQLNNGTDVNGVAAAIAEHNRRTLAGFGG